MNTNLTRGECGTCIYFNTAIQINYCNVCFCNKTSGKCARIHRLSHQLNSGKGELMEFLLLQKQLIYKSLIFYFSHTVKAKCINGVFL